MIPTREVHGGEELSFKVNVPEKLFGGFCRPYRALDITIQTLEVGDDSDSSPISLGD